MIPPSSSLSLLRSSRLVSCFSLLFFSSAPACALLLLLSPLRLRGGLGGGGCIVAVRREERCVDGVADRVTVPPDEVVVDVRVLVGVGADVRVVLDVGESLAIHLPKGERVVGVVAGTPVLEGVDLG